MSKAIVEDGAPLLGRPPFRLALCALAAVGAAAASSAGAATYYVSPSGSDANRGTAASPWRTIQKAARTLVAGDTAVLMDGTYTEPSIAFDHSGTPAAPITFRAQNKLRAVVSSTSGCDPAFSVGGSYVTVEGIRFTVSPDNVACKRYTSTNAAIRAWQSNVPTPANPTTGTAGFTARGILVDHSPQRSLAVKSNQDSTLVEDSELHDQLELLNNAGSVLRHNVVHGEGTANDVFIVAKGGVRNARIYGNVVRLPAARSMGISLGGWSCDACHFDTTTNVEAYDSVAYDNVVVNDSAGTVAGLVFAGAEGCAFFDNVVIGGQIAARRGGHDTGPRAPVTRSTFANNVIRCEGAATSGWFGWTDHHPGGVTVVHNDFFRCTSAVPEQASPITGAPLFVGP